MDNKENKENKEDKIEQVILNRYLDKNKTGYWMRIRKKSKSNNEYIVYYNGIKVFSYQTNEKHFELNKAVFLLNGKNYKEYKEKEENNLANVKKDVAGIEELDFYFEIKNKITIPSTKSRNRYLYNKNKEQIKNEIYKEYSKYIQLDKNACIADNKEISIILKKEAQTKKRAQIITFEKILKLEKIGYDITISPSRKQTKGVQKIEINDSITLNITPDDLKKFSQKTWNEKQKKWIKPEENWDKLEKIMERRINIYCNPEEKDRQEDFSIPSKTENNQEKQFQQKLMDYMNNEEQRKRIVKEKQTCFTMDTIPFEMEFTSYQYKEEQGKLEKSIQSIKGRVDNIFIRNHTLILVELKYGSGVIGGTNGIHKHLLDILSCFEKKDSKEEVLNEVTGYIKNRNDILKANNMEEYVIKGFENEEDKLEDIEYYIICGYQEKESVQNAIKDIYEKTYREIMLPTNLEQRKREEKEEVLKKMLDKEYKERYINTYKIDDFIKDLIQKKILKNVEIYLVNGEYQNFEKYKK